MSDMCSKLQRIWVKLNLISGRNEWMEYIYKHIFLND